MPRIQKFKLLITDLDGTAVPMSPDGVPSKAVIAAIKKAQQKIHVSIATGRPLSMCNHIIKLLDIKSLSIVHGGTQILNPVTFERVWYQPLNIESMAEIIKACEPYEFFDEGHDAKPRLATQTTLAGNQDLMVLLAVEEHEGLKILEKLKLIQEINISMVHSWTKGKFDLHITHIGASKRHATEVLLGMLNIEKHEVIAIGDGGNDLPLFEAAGFKVAMGNASDDLKAKADFIADTVDNDGLAKVIEKFIL